MSKLTPVAGLYGGIDSTPLNTIMTINSAVIDGDLMTAAVGFWHLYESFGVDLGSAYNPAFIKFYDNYAAGTDYTVTLNVYYSSDNSTWTLLGNYSKEAGNILRTGGSPGIWTITLNTSISARYWRIYGAASSPASVTIGGVSTASYLTEMEMYTVETETVVITSSAYILLPLSLLSSSAYILPYTEADPYHFVYENDDNVDEVTPISYREPKLKHVCDHVLSTGTYKLTTCPRCAGNGYYYDAKLDSQGLVIQISGVNKLQQELEKIIRTALGDNKIHTDYGALLNSSYSNVISEELKNKLKSSLSDAVYFIKHQQDTELSAGTAYTSDELIYGVENIDIFDIYGDPTAIGYSIGIITLKGSLFTVEGTIII